MRKSTEEQIKEAAKKVFIEKGFAQTTTRDIALAADTNLALINYYFRSKENLFARVFEETQQEFVSSIMEMLNKDLPLREKIERLIDRDFEFLSQNPDISTFILHEMRVNTEACKQRHALDQERFHQSLFVKQVQVAIDNGELRNIPPAECIIAILSNIQFVFIAKPMLQQLTGYDEAAYQDFLLSHKNRVKEMVFSYLFLKP